MFRYSPLLKIYHYCPKILIGFFNKNLDFYMPILQAENGATTGGDQYGGSIMGQPACASASSQRKPIYHGT